MNICVVGGGGYVGSALVPYLSRKGHFVTVLDTWWYGDHIAKHPSIQKLYGDIRNKKDLAKAFKGQDAVIHLACVSNDPSFDMNPLLGKEINYECFKHTLTALKEAKVQRFIYASSSSVYGVSHLPKVTEDAPKSPLTDYSKYKLLCEAELKAYGMGGVWTVVRPATVCGYAPRMRLDLVVNILTIQAIINKNITLFGTEQRRPNINIMDMVRAYEFILDADQEKIDQKVFNVGDENLKLVQLAARIKDLIPDTDIEERPTNDPRSYHICSDKIKALGFAYTHSISGAIKSVIAANEEKLFKDPMNNPEYYNIKKMKGLGLI